MVIFAQFHKSQSPSLTSVTLAWLGLAWPGFFFLRDEKFKQSLSMLKSCVQIPAKNT